MNAGATSRERRWIVLGEDGRYVSLGRHSDPTEEEILLAEAALRAQELAGWLVIAEGDFHDPGGPPKLLEVRALAQPGATFQDGVAAFQRRSRV